MNERAHRATCMDFRNKSVVRWTARMSIDKPCLTAGGGHIPGDRSLTADQKGEPIQWPSSARTWAGGSKAVSSTWLSVTVCRVIT